MPKAPSIAPIPGMGTVSAMWAYILKVKLWITSELLKKASPLASLNYTDNLISLFSDVGKKSDLVVDKNK